MAFILGLFGVLVWAVLQFTLIRQVDETLDRTVDQLLKTSVTSINSRNSEIMIELPFDAIESPGLYMQLFNTNRELIGNSMTISNLESPMDAASLHGQELERNFRYTTLFGNRLRVLTTPVVVNGTHIGYLQVASSLKQIDVAQSAVLLLMSGGGFVAILLSIIFSSLTVQRALRPLETVTSTALQITRADDLSMRIDHQGSYDDEIGRLVTSFNDVLGRLERLFYSQKRFLTDISHELRTPLTAIRGNVDLLRRIGEGDPESLDAIQSETERLTRLAGDLLTLAEAETGSLPMAFQKVELDTLLLDVYRDARVLAGTKVAVKLGEEDQAMVWGDPDRIKQVLLNLISNAIKYTPHGGTVTLGLKNMNDWGRVTVTDTGDGIPIEEIPHIFDRFYRVDKSRTRRSRAGGSGLGLSIVKWLVEAHEGRIDVTSQPNKGSTFTVWLPIMSAEQHTQQNSIEKRSIRLPLEATPVSQ